MSKVIEVTIEEEHYLRDANAEKTLEVEVLKEEVVNNQILEKKTFYVKGWCGGDHQPNGKYGTPTRGAIPSTFGEGDFVIGHERRNPRTITIESCATKLPRNFANTKKWNYTTKWIKVFTTSRREPTPSWLKKKWCCHNE